MRRHRPPLPPPLIIIIIIIIIIFIIIIKFIETADQMQLATYRQCIQYG